MTKKNKIKYTLVEHSGLNNAVELTSVSTKAEISKIQMNSGMLFDSYEDADQAEYIINYPPEVDGIMPHRKGGFSRKKINGSRLYIPTGDDLLRIEKAEA